MEVNRFVRLNDPHFINIQLTEVRLLALGARSPLLPGRSRYSFLLEPKSTSGPYYGWRDYVNEKNTINLSGI
jgi:hypothetical protein